MTSRLERLIGRRGDTAHHVIGQGRGEPRPPDLLTVIERVGEIAVVSALRLTVVAPAEIRLKPGTPSARFLHTRLFRIF